MNDRVISGAGSESALARCRLFAGLPSSLLTAVARQAGSFVYKNGEVILGEGDEGRYVFVLTEGLVKLSIAPSGRNETVLDILRPHASYGAESCFDISPNLVAVRAVAASRVLAISRDRVAFLVHNHPAFANALLESLGSVIRRRTIQMNDLLYLELHQRVSKLFVGMLAFGGDRGPEERTVSFGLSLNDIAGVVGGAPAAVREVMDFFQQMGYLDMRRGEGIVIREPDKLRSLVDEGVSWGKLTRQAFSDPLTSLPNRVMFQRRAASALARAKDGGRPGAIIYIDLDDFKLVNDTFGHAAGDHLLVAVADRLRVCIRPSDTPARFGGDEFGILVEDFASLQDAIIVAERIVASIGAPFTLPQGEARIAASLGVAAFGPGDDVEIEEVLANADRAMYAAKRLGKGRYIIYGADILE